MGTKFKIKVKDYNFYPIEFINITKKFNRILFAVRNNDREFLISKTFKEFAINNEIPKNTYAYAIIDKIDFPTKHNIDCYKHRISKKNESKKII